MDKDKLLYWSSLAAACVAIAISSIAIAKHNISSPSTPVEETYHRQLVITLDSVLDAHLNAATNTTDTVKTDNVRFDKYFEPME